MTAWKSTAVSIAAGIAFAAGGFIAPSPGEAPNCDDFAWPNYPAACLAAADGSNLSDKKIRTAVAYPPRETDAPTTTPPLPAKSIPPIERRFDDPLYFPPPEPATHRVTVWRAGNPTHYIVAGM
jgi:hypothetical protein